MARVGSHGNHRVRISLEGKVHGVLIDFDLGTVAGWMLATDSTLDHRTGTLPWLAWDLLRTPAPPHCVRFDVESLFYVIMWHAVNYRDGEPIACSACLKPWLSARREENAGAKHQLMSYLIGDRIDFAGRSMWKGCLVAIARALEKGRTACSELPQPMDHDSPGWLTMDGWLTIPVVREQFRQMKEVAHS